MIYTRLSYNTNSWESLSGSYGKSRNRGVHEFDYGFGFEECLFSKSNVLTGNDGNKQHFGYIEGINKNYRNGDENESLVLFTINNTLHQRFIVGEIMKWKIVSPEESAFLVLHNFELIETMREQVAEATNNNVVALYKFDLHRHNENGHQLFNVKYEGIDFTFNIDNPVNQGHITNKFNRFWLYRR